MSRVERPAAPGDQPPPVHRPGEPSVHELVRDWLAGHEDVDSARAAVQRDLMERAAVGIERYGTPLQCGNGRDALWDAYQEALDTHVYVGQAYHEAQRVGDVPEVGQRFILLCAAAHLCDRLRRAIDRRDNRGRVAR